MCAVWCVWCRHIKPEKVTEMLNLKFKFNWISAALDSRIASHQKRMKCVCD